MWNRYGLPITIIGLGLTASLVSYEFADAARSRDYTPREMRSVLHGFGYKIAISDAPLTDKEAIAALREFQQGYKITVDGKPGPKTQDLAADLVQILQASMNLVLKPSPALPRTQFYGSLTEAAVRRLQEKYNLPVTGIADLALRQRLDQEAEAILNNQSPSPSPSPSPSASPSPSPSASPSPSRLRRPSASPSPSVSPSPSASPAPLRSPSSQTRPKPSPSPSPQAKPKPDSSQ